MQHLHQFEQERSKLHPFKTCNVLGLEMASVMPTLFSLARFFDRCSSALNAFCLIFDLRHFHSRIIRYFSRLLNHTQDRRALLSECRRRSNRSLQVRHRSRVCLRDDSFRHHNPRIFSRLIFFILHERSISPVARENNLANFPAAPQPRLLVAIKRHRADDLYTVA